MTDEKRAYNKEYDRQNTKMISLKLNYRTDADLIRLLGSKKNIQGYIKECLRRAL